MEFWKFDKSKFVEFNYLKILSVIEFFSIQTFCLRKFFNLFETIELKIKEFRNSTRSFFLKTGLWKADKSIQDV